MVGSEGESDFKEFKGSDVVTIPKRISLEMSILKIRDKNKEEIRDHIFDNLNRIKNLDPAVKPPFKCDFIEK